MIKRFSLPMAFSLFLVAVVVGLAGVASSHGPTGQRSQTNIPPDPSALVDYDALAELKPYQNQAGKMASRSRTTNIGTEAATEASESVMNVFNRTTSQNVHHQHFNVRALAPNQSVELGRILNCTTGQVYYTETISDVFNNVVESNENNNIATSADFTCP